MNVDVPTHRVDLAKAIKAHGAAREPQDARENPVAVRIARAELGCPGLPGRAPPDENCVERHASADLRSDDVPATGRAVAAATLSGPVRGRRYRIGRNEPGAIVDQCERLAGKRDLDPRQVGMPPGCECSSGRRTRNAW